MGSPRTTDGSLKPLPCTLFVPPSVQRSRLESKQENSPVVYVTHPQEQQSRHNHMRRKSKAREKRRSTRHTAPLCDTDYQTLDGGGTRVGSGQPSASASMVCLLGGFTGVCRAIANAVWLKRVARPTPPYKPITLYSCRILVPVPDIHIHYMR